MTIQLLPNTALPITNIRQTILNGPVDTNGLASFGGSTGGVSVTATATLVASAAFGISDYFGTVVNPSWSSIVQSTSGTAIAPVASPGVVTWNSHPLSVGEPVVFSGATLPTGIVAGTTYYVISAGYGANSFQIASAVNGTAINFTGTSSGTQTCAAQTSYLYLEISNNGVITTGSTTHQPVYQHGGTYSTVNNAHTFNIQEMTMKVGNGSIATQVYRVFVGECAITGTTVNSITWYALLGRYTSADQTITSSTPVTVSSNLGVLPRYASHKLRCLTAEQGYSVGDIVGPVMNNGTGVHIAPVSFTRNTITMLPGTSGTAFYSINKSSSAQAALTNANWKQFVEADRGW